VRKILPTWKEPAKGAGSSKVTEFVAGLVSGLAMDSGLGSDSDLALDSGLGSASDLALDSGLGSDSGLAMTPELAANANAS
jgi:hypothetical protein